MNAYQKADIIIRASWLILAVSIVAYIFVSANLARSEMRKGLDDLSAKLKEIELEHKRAANEMRMLMQQQYNGQQYNYSMGYR